MMLYRVPFAIAVVAAAAGGLAGCGDKPKAESAKAQARSVSVVAIDAREIQGGLVASGALIPREDTAIFPQISGYRVAGCWWTKARQ